MPSASELLMVVLAALSPSPMAKARAQPVDPQAVLPPALPWSGASERLVAPADDPWITPAERAGFRTTPSYAETRAWLEQLASVLPLLTLETFGKSGEGRDLPMVRARKGSSPKPVVLVQAATHSIPRLTASKSVRLPGGTSSRLMAALSRTNAVTTSTSITA